MDKHLYMRGQGINQMLPNNCKEMVAIGTQRVEVRMWYPLVAMFPTQLDAASTLEQCSNRWTSGGVRR
eukprot:11959439-Ditylum_brightwellii.AAC.1